jgi:hypothetical protein
MSNSKVYIERCIRRALKGKANGKKHRGGPKGSSGGLSKSRSFLSMDNLDIQEEEEDNEASSNKSDDKPLSTDSEELLEIKKTKSLINNQDKNSLKPLE